MTMNVHIQRAVLALLVAAGFVAAAYAGVAIGHAEESLRDRDLYAYEVSVQPPFSPVDGLVRCQYEDGNPDGLPCVWTDPDTGDLYYNDGSNYRD